MGIIVECIEVGPLAANCYIAHCEATGAGFVVDPGGDTELILDAIARSGARIEYILDTHAHPDHIEANCSLREELTTRQGSAPKLLVHAADRDAVEHPPMHWLLLGMRIEPCTVDGTFADGDELAVGELQVRVMSVPGHSPGSVTLVCDGLAFTGDTLFANGIGRTDFPGGSSEQIMQSLRRLITELPESTRVLPGHGPESTIGDERRTNDWLQSL